MPSNESVADYVAAYIVCIVIGHVHIVVSLGLVVRLRLRGQLVLLQGDVVKHGRSAYNAHDVLELVRQSSVKAEKASLPQSKRPLD